MAVTGYDMALFSSGHATVLTTKPIHLNAKSSSGEDCTGTVEHQQEHQKTQGTVLLPLNQKGASANPLLP